MTDFDTLVKVTGFHTLVKVTGSGTLVKVTDFDTLVKATDFDTLVKVTGFNTFVEVTGWFPPRTYLALAYPFEPNRGRLSWHCCFQFVTVCSVPRCFPAVGSCGRRN